MPNWCTNHIVVTGPVEEIARFTQTCIRPNEDEDYTRAPFSPSRFDFNRLIPMPAILEGTVAGSFVDDALLVLGRTELICTGLPSVDDIEALKEKIVGLHSLEEQMKRYKVDDIEALKEKIGPEAFENARQSIEAFEQTGAPNWYVWSNKNWGTKWNAADFEVIKEEPGRYECEFNTAWAPPEPVYVKLAEMFPNLCFEINGLDDQLNFDFLATNT
jgi:hypothetical protein